MKFKGTGIVWDAQNNRALVEFENGVVETTDERIIKILKDNGFQELEVKSETPSIDVESDIEPEVTNRESWNEIKRKATSLGIFVKGKKKDELLKLIKEKENVDHIN
jgi:hypothetical protein